MLRQLYYNLIYPYLTYANISWGNTYKTRLTKVITKQNKAVRSIFYANSRESTEPLYILLQILKFIDILKLKVASLTYKIINKSSDISKPFQNYFTLASSTHQYSTRFASKQNITRPKVRTNYGVHTFKFISSQIWENIPDNIKNLKSFSSFKYFYKEFLIKNNN